MSGELRLDLAGLRERGARLTELADRVGQTYAGLRDCLDQARGSWGDDYMGRQFAEQFTPHADQMLANVRAMEKGLHSTAAGIVRVADEFDAQDAGNAARLADAADDQAPGSGSSPTLQPNNAASPTAPVDTGAQVPYDPAASSPGRNSAGADGPAQRAGGTQHAGQPPAGGSQSPNGSPARTVPQDGAQSRSPWNQDRPTSDPSGQDGRNPAGGSGRRTSPVSARPSSSAPPPADRRAAPGATDASSGGRATPTKRGDTPWGGQPPRPSGTPGRTETPGKTGSPSRPESNPRHGSPPRSDRSSRDKARADDRRRSREQRASDPMIGWLARTVAERHGVEVTGFDTPGLQVPPVRDFLAAVDRVLTDYPMIQLDSVAVAELDGERGTVRWRREPGDEGATSSMTLDLRTAQEPAAAPTPEPGGEPVRSDIYPATLHEFGRALDDAGGGVARKQAQRVLIGEYLRREPRPDRTLAEVVSGYRDWRAGLAGKSAIPGEFDVGHALGIAFAEVVQHGAEAGIQARLLHAVLVAAASRPV
ncbi:hypothetical protein IRT45_21340 [Nocardia sp. BSTN01]|uniref:hypothetical protein n=1 Tax=Nocardia sp. BSTN01 TaxID=2783665 RepID=UPI00188E19D7|nr:hypothetical protein [Nocardia sp. BSTN01]MBF4999692.1 hypothetical protein [Nocardia sp. BSTN01]